MGEINSFQKYRADWILHKIEEGSTVLDIGCGDGGILLYLLERKCIVPIGADLSDYALNFLKSKGVDAIKCDLNNMSDIETLPQVDYVIVFEILEHLQNPERLLKLLERKARKAIFFSIPNSGYFPYRLRMLFGSFPVQWRVHPGEHVRFWTYRDLRWWLREMGYEGKYIVHIYEGIPRLNRIWGGLFGMAFVGEIRCE